MPSLQILSPLMPAQRPALIAALTDIARLAGKTILTYYSGLFWTKQKRDNSLVTEADVASESLILKAIENLCPGVCIISEEAWCTSEQIFSKEISQPFFLIDPLDGTAGFVKKNGQFTVNIALIENKKPTLGVLYAPFYNRLFCGFWDKENKPHAWEETAHACHILHLDTMDQASGIICMKAGSSAPLEDYFGSCVPTIRKTHTLGSALKFGFIAAGQADLYLCKGPTMEWDSAAGHVIVECAGGIVQLWDGSPLIYGKVDRGFKNPRFIVSKKWRNS